MARRNEQKFIEAYEKCPDMVAFDIGANVGMYTWRMAERFQKCYSFEACPATYKTLLENTNDLNNVEVINAGICNVDGPVKLFIQHAGDGRNKGGNSLSLYVAEAKKWGHDPNRSIEVPGITLDTFCKERNINNLRLIKMDIEGGENFAWQGAKETLKNNKLDIVLETHDCVNFEDLFQFFKDYGYKIFDLANDERVGMDKFKLNSHYLITNRR